MRVWGRGSRYRSHLLTYFMAFSTVFITIAMVIYPKEAFDSALLGLNLWWNVVFPSLLPFFILSEILMGLGVVHFIGVLLEPLMRPLFNVPGVGAFAKDTDRNNKQINLYYYYIGSKNLIIAFRVKNPALSRIFYLPMQEFCVICCKFIFCQKQEYLGCLW